MVVQLLLSLGLFISAGEAQDDLQYSMWEDRLFKSTPATIEALMLDMWRTLPNEQQWPKPARDLLLKIIDKHYANGKEREIPKPEGPGCSIPGAHPMYVVDWQSDPRFLPYAVEVMSVNFLVRAGESSLPFVIKDLYNDRLPGRQFKASVVIDSMFIRQYPFMQDDRNKSLIRQGLVHIVNYEKSWGIERAISALRYVKNEPVINLLQSIQGNEAHRPQVRQQAAEALRF